MGQSAVPKFLQNVALRAEAVQENVEAFLQQEHPFGKEVLVVALQILDAFAVSVADLIVFQQLKHVFVV